VKSVESRALSAVVFLRREQRLQLTAEGLPTRVLVMAATVMGKDRQGYRPESGEARKRLFFLRSCWPLLLLDGFQGANGDDDVSGLGLLATGDRNSGRPWFWFIGRRGGRRLCSCSAWIELGRRVGR